MKRKIGQFFTLSVASLSALFIQTGHALTADKIIAFGDSLSDNGNIFALTTAAHNVVSSVPVIPKGPTYYEGRFTNGLIWLDHLSKSMNASLDDYAYGGAWAESVLDSKQVIPFSLSMQVNFYLVREALDFHKNQHLYIIWVGGNDYSTGRSDPDYATTNVVSNIKDQIEWLTYYGAEKFLILNLPDLGYTPGVSEKGPEFAAGVSKLSQLHDSKLAAMIEEERKEHPTIQIVTIDIASYFTDLMSHPEKYQLKNVTQACYGGGYSLARIAVNHKEIKAAKEANIDILNNASLRTAYLTSVYAASGQQPCDNPDDYLYWDHIHPTQGIHQKIAAIAFDTLSSVAG